MDLVAIRTAVELGKSALTDLTTATAHGEQADSAGVSLVKAVANTFRRQMSGALVEAGIPADEIGGELLIDSSKPIVDAWAYARDRWLQYVNATVQYLEAYERLKPQSEALRNLNQANEFVALVEGVTTALVKLNERAYREAHPQAPGTGLGDMHIATPDWAIEMQADIEEILMWVRDHTGTGEPPVVALEGVVGAFVRYLPWHATAGATDIYGGTGQPKQVIGPWQYDALFKSVQTGKALTVSTTERNVRIHLTRQEPDHYWISVGVAEIPTGTLQVIVSDLDTAGNRVVQRLHV